MAVVDAVTRKLPGALGRYESHLHDSFSEALGGRPEYPHYTRPEEFRGWPVPAVLLSGDHGDVARWREQQSHRRAGSQYISFGGWQADTGDPENFLGVFFHSANKGGVNTSFYGEPEVDQLLNQANEETDQAKRKALFNQAEHKIVDDAPWLFISHAKQQVAIRKRVKDFVLQPTYIYYFNNVSLG